MSETTDKFKIYNDLQSKNLLLAVEIEGVPGLLASNQLYQTLVYGLPGVDYGDPGLIYGGLLPLDSWNGGEVRQILSRDASSLVLSQKIEPEQGRGSVSQLTLAFIDKDKYMTQLLSPGIIVDDILGKKVKVYLGYKELAFPKDYHIIFRGKISGITSQPGVAILNLSDSNIGRRQTIFYNAKTKLSAPITDTDTTIPVISNADFHKHILGPDGSYDPAVRLYFKIEDEIIEYGPTYHNPTGTFGTNTFGNCVRGSRGTAAVAHAVDQEVEVVAQLEDHAIDMALKIMLSGWVGPCLENITISSVLYTGDPILGLQSTAYILPINKDAIRDYGLSVEDYVTFTGDSIPANNGTFQVTGFGDLEGDANRIIYTTNTSATLNSPSTAVMSIRSKYDTYPVTFANKLTTDDVDVEQHEYLKTTFLSDSANSYRFYITEKISGKTFIESEIYLPIAAYSLTRFGRMSIGLTKPPIASLRLKFLNEDNILNAPSIAPNRAINNRRFFNEINWQYDKNDDGTYVSQIRTLDTDSVTVIGINSVLPITSAGGKTDLGVEPLIQRRTSYLLSRYKKGAVEINVKVNFQVGIEIEGGDVVALQDDGRLQIANYETGERNIGTQLYEVTERSLNLKDGTIDLKLVSGLGARVTDRYGVISPSSVVDSGSTINKIKIVPSYGQVFDLQEKKKWENYIGQLILIHNDDWTVSFTALLVGTNPASNTELLVENMSTVPSAGYIVEINDYPVSTNPDNASIYKNIHAFLSPAVPVTSGSSVTEFFVSASDIAKFSPGRIVLVHEPEWSYYSGEVLVTAVDTMTYKVTVGTSLGFTPSASDLIEFIGFDDGGGAYRWI